MGRGGEGGPNRAAGEELEARADRLVDTKPDGSSEDGEGKGEPEAPSTTADRLDEGEPGAGEAGGVPTPAPGTYGGVSGRGGPASSSDNPSAAPMVGQRCTKKDSQTSRPMEE